MWTLQQGRSFEGFVDVLGLDEAGADVFLGARRDGVDRVDVELEVVGEVRGHHAAGEPADVLQAVGQPREVVEVGQGRGAVFTGADIQGAHRRPAGAVVDLAASDLDVVLGIAAVQHEVPPGPGDHILDEGGGEREPALLRQAATLGQRLIDHHLRHLAHADGLEDLQGRAVDLGHLGLGERPVAAALEARPDRRDLVLAGLGPELAAGLAPALAAAYAARIDHAPPPPR